VSSVTGGHTSGSWTTIPAPDAFYKLGGWSTDGRERVVELFGITLPEVRYVKDI
jgi:hypothetical protein